MSSVIAFIRALMMVACLVAVPVLAISQGSTISRGLQTAARFLDRISADAGQSEPDEPLVDGALRSARPMPSPAASPSQSPTSTEPTRPAPTLLPEPVAERDKTRHRNPPAPHSERPADTSEAPEPAAEHDPQASPPGSRVASWKEMASSLQELGALEYALEKWGESGELYRFRCLAAVPGTTAYQRHFHAVDADGGRAVEQVVEQVRVWRASSTGSK